MCFHVESAYLRFVAAGLRWPNPAKIPDAPDHFHKVYRCRCPSRESPKSEDRDWDLYKGSFVLVRFPFRNSSFALSSFVLVSERNFTPTSVGISDTYVCGTFVWALFLRRYTCHCEARIPKIVWFNLVFTKKTLPEFMWGLFIFLWDLRKNISNFQTNIGRGGPLFLCWLANHRENVSAVVITWTPQRLWLFRPSVYTTAAEPPQDVRTWVGAPTLLGPSWSLFSSSITTGCSSTVPDDSLMVWRRIWPWIPSFLSNLMVDVATKPWWPTSAALQPCCSASVAPQRTTGPLLLHQ